MSAEPEVRPPVSTTVAYVFLVITMILWSGGVIVSRAVHELTPPIGLSFWRWLAASVLLLPLAWRPLRARSDYVRRHWARLLLLGVFMTGAGTLLVWGVQFTTATNVLLVNSTQPVVTAVIAWLLLRQRLGVLQVLGAVVALLGIAIIVTRNDLPALLRLEINPGDALVLLGVIGYAVYAINLPRWIDNIEPVLLLFLLTTCGTACLLPFFLIEWALVGPVPVRLDVIGAILFMAVASTMIATSLWNTAIRSVDVNRAAIFVNLMPVFGTAFAVTFLDEHLALYHLAGALCVAAGIALVIRGQRTG